MPLPTIDPMTRAVALNKPRLCAICTVFRRCCSWVCIAGTGAVIAEWPHPRVGKWTNSFRLTLALLRTKARGPEPADCCLPIPRPRCTCLGGIQAWHIARVPCLVPAKAVPSQPVWRSDLLVPVQSSSGPCWRGTLISDSVIVTCEPGKARSLLYPNSYTIQQKMPSICNSRGFCVIYDSSSCFSGSRHLRWKHFRVKSAQRIQFCRQCHGQNRSAAPNGSHRLAHCW